MATETYKLKLDARLHDGFQGREFFVGAVCPSGYVLLYEMTATGVGLVLWRKSEKYEFEPLAHDERFTHLIPDSFFKQLTTAKAL